MRNEPTDMSKNKVIVGLWRDITKSVIKDVEVPQEVFENVDHDDYITMSQVMDEWVFDNFPGFCVYKIRITQ